MMAFYVSKGNHLFIREADVLRFRGTNIIEVEKACKHEPCEYQCDEYSEDLVSFIRKMISPNERDRPTAKEVVKETYKNDRNNRAWYNK